MQTIKLYCKLVFAENYENYLQIITLLLPLLNNLVLEFVDGKKAAANSGLAQVSCFCSNVMRTVVYP